MSGHLGESSTSSGMGNDLRVLDHMLARGEILPTQLPSYCNWTPEKKLAAAAFTSALFSIRNHSDSDNPRHRREAQHDLAWVEADDTEWPYSFLRMCELFSLEPDWVRKHVRNWVATAGAHEGRRYSRQLRAA